MIYFLVLFVLIALLVLCAHVGDEKSFGFSGLMIVVWVGCAGGSHFSHVGDLATIETQQQTINIQKEKVERLNTVLISLKSNNTALMNADTPMTKLIEEIALSEKDFANARISLVAAKKSIAAREKSIFKWVM